jgi:hypothetical protein
VKSRFIASLIWKPLANETSPPHADCGNVGHVALEDAGVLGWLNGWGILIGPC